MFFVYKGVVRCLIGIALSSLFFTFNTYASDVPQYTLPHGEWRLLSIPGELGEEGNVANTFGDDVDGEYSADWVVFTYDALGRNYRRLGLSDSLEAGTGYWVIQNTGVEVTLDLPASFELSTTTNSPSCVSEYGCVSKPVESNLGHSVWNLLGFPLETSSLWGDARISGGLCNPLCTPAASEAADNFYSGLWKYDPDTSGYVAISETASIAPWDGYWGLALKGGEDVSVLYASTRPPELQEITGQLLATSVTGLEISGKHFKCSGQSPYQALIINKSDVVVTDNLFTDCYAGIIIDSAQNTHITGNRFENTGQAIREKDGAGSTTVEFNEFQGVGVTNCTDAPEWDYHVNGYWACDVFQSIDGSNGKILNNLVDNRGLNTRYIEDFININGAGTGFEISNNLMIGSSEDDSASPSGGCIVIDGTGSDHVIEANRCFSTAGYGIGSAGASDVRIEKNRVYIPREHAIKLSFHPAKTDNRAGSFSYASSNYQGPCGTNVQFVENEGYAYSVDVDPDDGLIEWGGARNISGTCLKNNIGVVLADNEWLNSDPLWEPPVNIFDGLDTNYFSGRR